MVGDVVRRDLVREFAAVDRRDGTLMALQGKRVLRVARYLPAFGHFFRGQAHAVGNAVVLVLLEDGRVERDLVAHHRHHAHALHARRQHHICLAETDAVCRQRHGLHAGGAEAVDGQSRHRVRQSCQQQGDTRHVHALLRFRHGTADDHVADAGRVERRRLRQHTLQYVRQHVVRTGVAEHAARFANRRARRGNDVGFLYLFAHVRLLKYFNQRSFLLYPSPPGRGGTGVRETIMARSAP